MKKTVASPRDLFFDQLRDLFSMEREINRHLPYLIAIADDERLRTHLMDHSHETERQVAVVLNLFDQHGEDPGDDACKAIEGLINGGKDHLESVKDEKIRDLMVIAHCLRIEYYEMAAYEITCRLAGQIGLPDEAGILLALLSQEQVAAEALLTLQPTIFGEANR